MKDSHKQKHSHRQLLQLGSSIPMKLQNKSASKVKEDRRSIFVINRVNIQIPVQSQQSEGAAQKQVATNFLHPNIKSTNMKIKFHLAQERVKQEKQLQIQIFSLFKDLTPQRSKVDQDIEVPRLHKLILPPVSKTKSMPKAVKKDGKVEITPRKLDNQKMLSQSKVNKDVVEKKTSVTLKLEDNQTGKLKKIGRQANKNELQMKRSRPSQEESSIISLILYRLQAQNYQFTSIEQRIRDEGESTIIQQFIRNLLVKQPFFLSQSQAATMVHYLMQSHIIQSPSQVIEALRNAIGKINIINLQMKMQTLFQLAVVASQNQQIYTHQFEEINVISQQKLTQLLREMQFSNTEVDIVIAELCMCSQNLQQLRYGQLLGCLW